MAKKLLIVESPVKAHTIQGFLGPEWVVKASVGHVRDIPLPKAMSAEEKKKYGAYGLDLAHGFEPLYRVTPDKTKVMKELREALAKAEELYLGTDSDAEGAAIAWHLLQELKPRVPTYRVTWNEITQEAVEAGLAARELVDASRKLPQEFFGQAEAALTRGSWDRLYGFATSPYVWKTVRRGGSSGRVQSPGARLVVEREEARLAFKSVPYYTVRGVFDGVPAVLTEVGGQRVATSSSINEEGVVQEGHLLITEDTVEELLKELEAREYTVAEVKSRPYRRTPPPPFTTSTALQAIGSRTGMSTKQVTAVFQKLFMEGKITYIRTVSVVAAQEAVDAARSELLKRFGKTVTAASPRVYRDKKQGNSGHECLRPVVESGKLLEAQLADSREQAVFDIIRSRMLASQASDCTGTTWTAVFASSDGWAKFSASETEILDPGWTKVYAPDDSDEEEASS